MTRHEFELPGHGMVTSLVMTEEEFDAFCDKIEKLPLDEQHPERVKKVVDNSRKKGLVSGVSRGTKTEHLFVEYEIKTPMFSACRQGFAKSVIGEGTVTVTRDAAKELIDTEYEKLNDDQKKAIADLATDLFTKIKGEYGTKGLDEVRPLIVRFVSKWMKVAPREFRLAFIDDVLSGIVQTLTVRLYQLEDPFSEDFDGYLRRLVTGIVVTGEALKTQQGDKG